MEIIFNFIKRNRKNPFVLLLSFLYSITSEYINTLINVVAPIYLSVIFESDKKNTFLILLIIYAVIEMWYNFVNIYNNYKNKSNVDNRRILDEINIIMTTLDNYINNNDNVEGVFEFASDLVSASLYHTIPTIIEGDIRISIIQQFKSEEKKQCIMLSRNSRTRQKAKKSINTVKYEKNKDYYYKKILLDNKESLIIFNEEQIDKYFYYKNKDMKSDIKQYLCIPIKHQTNDIIFLLQLDSMKENAFGKRKEEVNEFYNNYIYPYICFLRHAYNIERNLKKKEGDKNE